jgi:hypothetical protein
MAQSSLPLFFIEGEFLPFLKGEYDGFITNKAIIV